MRSEDQPWLAEGGLTFDLNCIIGGQLPGDDEHKLFLLYPEGNWVEVRVGTPYAIIGESRYGKPLLDRAWRYEYSLEAALRAGLLSFDATRTSATDVDPPVDVVLYRRDGFEMHEHRLTVDDLAPLTAYWNAAIDVAVAGASETVAPLFQRVSTDGSPPG